LYQSAEFGVFFFLSAGSRRYVYYKGRDFPWALRDQEI
jgi:hypothetical protein